MQFYTNIVSKRDLNGHKSETRINVSKLPIIVDLIPNEESLKEWALQSYVALETKQPVQLIHIKVVKSLFEEIVKELYWQIGKYVSLQESRFRIPMKTGNAFFEEINHITLISEELSMETIVIHV